MGIKRTEQCGFSMIELLVVIAIIGLLAAIAISEFSVFKQQASDHTALADLRNVLTAQEAHFQDNGSYTNDLNNLVGMVVSADVEISFESANSNGWSGSAYSTKGGVTYCYDSTGSATIESIDGQAAACP